MATPSHYEVLSLPQPLLDETSDDRVVPTIVKQAYHRALLRHHPDKAPTKPTTTASPFPSSTTTPAAPATFTVDQITTAYNTLSRPALRAEYNAHLRTLPAKNTTTTSTPSAFQTGIETLDLDDLAAEEDSRSGATTWFKPCRCGNERGFVLGEPDLEEAGDLGELIVGCQDCSLWLRVCFAVMEDGDGEVKAPSRGDDKTVEQSAGNGTG